MPVRSNLFALGVALCAALLTPGAHAQTANGLRLGAAVGSTDYGTGLKGQLSDRLPLTALPGAWRWEAQAVSYGSERYTQFGNSFDRSAWAVGGSLLPQLPLGGSFSAYGKLGLHYLHAEASGPGLSERKNNLKLGYGGGLLWQATRQFGVKLELENIGGSGGDIVSLGFEVAL